MDPSPRRAPSTTSALPRASGDGPPTARCRRQLVWAPPRQRGWTAYRARVKRCHPGSPAPAGMDLCPRHGPQSARRLPRASGDGPPTCRFHDRLSWAPPRQRGWTAALVDPRALRHGSPRQRGWTAGARRAGRRRCGSPAPAGMDRRPSRGSRSACRLPRASGDGPLEGPRRGRGRQAPPRQRGWTHGHPRGRARGPGSPAPAGMDPSCRRRGRAPRGLPRASGDGPWSTRITRSGHWAPPRQRGWTAAGGLLV